MNERPNQHACRSVDSPVTWFVTPGVVPAVGPGVTSA